jgi:hypothetical protein
MKKTALFGLPILVLLVVAMSQIPAFKSTPSPAATFDEALAKFETLRREDSSHPLRPEGASRLFHHGHKTERVFVLLHGLTNCPEQFVPLAKILHAKGANVVLPRARLAGFADRLNNDQGHQTAQDLIDQHGYVLKNGKLKPPRDPAAARFLDVAEASAPFLIRLLVKLITKHVVQGKVVDASFQPSIYRGDMARLIVRAAEREGRPDIVEILES